MFRDYSEFLLEVGRGSEAVRAERLGADVVEDGVALGAVKGVCHGFVDHHSQLDYYKTKFSQVVIYVHGFLTNG